MLIDAHWISRWTEFALGQAGPPGPVSNRRLFEADEFAPSGPATDVSEGYHPCELPRVDREAVSVLPV